MYLISYKISSSDILDKFLEVMNKFGESKPLIPNVRILDSSLSSDEIFSGLYSVLTESDQIIFVPFQLENIHGYINTNILNWMREKSTKF